MLFTFHDFRLPDRFWDKIALERINGCWIWRGCRNREGYGTFMLGGQTLSAHRFAFEQLRGGIPSRLELDHLCRIIHCVNPDHLEAVTHSVNVLRGDSGSRKTGICRNGHDLGRPGALVTARERGKPIRQRCRLCQAEAMNRFRARSQSS